MFHQPNQRGIYSIGEFESKHASTMFKRLAETEQKLRIEPTKTFVCNRGRLFTCDDQGPSDV